ncbi:MAG: DUF4956 domain-containing protein [Planctomycetota bacterium]
MIQGNILGDWWTDAVESQGSFASILLRLLLAAVLGTAVALLYRLSRRSDERQPGFSQTLVLLAPLIAMVTAAVGQNVAAAFTLVGTLAIVRFRSALRDSRDMAFVIFSVAVGMATGALNLVVAATGFGVIAVVVLVLRAVEERYPGREGANLRLVITPPDVDPKIWTAVLDRYAQSHGILKCSVERKSNELDLRLSVAGVEPGQAPALLNELLALPQVTRASFAPDESNG